MTRKVLVCDPIARDGIELLAHHAEVDVCTGLPREKLLTIVGNYNALIVRSETRVTSEVIAAARNLRVVGRAGVGVDNIDLGAATERGIVVVNAPTGNIISAAEHTLGLMLALARNIPQANYSLKEGKWERSAFLGVELRGKTLGIIGLGQVGAEVARRARSLEMQVIAYDPFVPEERARVLNVELVSLEDLLRQSDFISLHTILTPETRNLIGAKEISLMKPTARIINTARGGLIDEEALYQALEEGRIAGAALDVFGREPATDNILLKSAKTIVTPHLGASTAEAQERVAVDVAEQIIEVLNGLPARYAVNAPLIAPEALSALTPYLPVAQKAASLATQLHEGRPEQIEIHYAGDIAEFDTIPLKAAVIRGLLEPITEEYVNIVNAAIVAQRRGLRISEHKGPSHEIYNNLITVRIATKGGATSVSGTLAHDGPHIVEVNDYWVDIPPADGYVLVCNNLDRPGTIGAVGTVIGQFDVNISFMNVGRTEKRGTALMVLVLDEPLTPEQLQKIRALPNIDAARQVRL